MARTWEVQSVRLLKGSPQKGFGYTKAQAKAWVKKHGHKTVFRGKGPEVMGRYWSFRQHDPGRYDGFRTLLIGPEIRIISGYRDS